MYFATTNKNKIAEAQRILGIPVEGVELQIDEIQTLQSEECAQNKAIAAFHAFGKPVLVEDTSLFFDAWKGQQPDGRGLPGVFIDYFMKVFQNEGLLKLMESETNRKALAQATLAISQDGKDATVFVGKIAGSISYEQRGTNNFGWDPIFIPEGSEKTFAEMTPEEKDHFSMRRMAFEEYKKARGVHTLA